MISSTTRKNMSISSVSIDVKLQYLSINIQTPEKQADISRILQIVFLVMVLVAMATVIIIIIQIIQ